MKTRHLRCPTRRQLFLLYPVFRKDHVDFALQFHLIRQFLSTDEHVQRQGLFILQQQVAALPHTFHTSHMDTHLGGIAFGHKEAARGNQMLRRKVQHKVLLISQFLTKRFVDHHLARCQSISICAPHIDRQQFLVHRHKTIHQQISLCMFHQRVLCQSVAHESRATGDDGLSPPQSLVDPLHQRTTHRVTQQQATRQHGNHQDDCQSDQAVEAAVVLATL